MVDRLSINYRTGKRKTWICTDKFILRSDRSSVTEVGSGFAGPQIMPSEMEGSRDTGLDRRGRRRNYRAMGHSHIRPLSRSSLENSLVLSLENSATGNGLDPRQVHLLELDVVLAGLGGQGSLVQVVEVGVLEGLVGGGGGEEGRRCAGISGAGCEMRRRGVEEHLLGGDPLAGVVDEHFLQEVQAGRLQGLHGGAQGIRAPVGEGRLEVGV